MAAVPEASRGVEQSDSAGVEGIRLANGASYDPTDFRTRQHAEELLQGALSRDPQNPAYLLALSRVYDKTGLTMLRDQMLARARKASMARPNALSTATLIELHYQTALALRQRLEWLHMRDSTPAVARALLRTRTRPDAPITTTYKRERSSNGARLADWFELELPPGSRDPVAVSVTISDLNSGRSATVQRQLNMQTCLQQ